MTIHWQWLPLIITVLLCLVNEIFGGGEGVTFSGILCAISGMISFVIYLILGVAWLFQHINII